MVDTTKKEMQKRFGQRVRELREEKKMTKTAVADLMGKEIQDVQQIEAGRRNVTLQTIIGLALALDVSPSQFFEFPLTDLSPTR